MRLHLGRHLQIGGFVILVVMMIQMILAEKPVQGLSAASPMQVCSFFANQPLSNQILVIRNMDDGSVVCTFNFTTAPYSVNCTEPGTFLRVKNKTYVEMVTNGQKNWTMEYGSGNDLKGRNLQATCEDMPENTVMEKVSNYTKSPDNSVRPKRDESDGSNHTVWIILGVLVVAVLVAFFLCILYISCERFKSRVQETFSRPRGFNMCRGIKTGTTSNANARSSPNEKYVSVPLNPIESGQ